MVEISATAGTARTNRLLHTKDQVTATRTLVNATSDCCWCSCDTEIPAFADLDNPTDRSKNDIFPWILDIPKSATVTATLTNLETGTTYAINDDTYGDLYPLDELRQYVWAFIIKWNNVADLIGFGTYSMNITVTGTVANELFNKDYPTFRLLPYSCDAVHNTVRIQTFNSGYIEGGFDYRGLSIVNPYNADQIINGWVQQIRYYGQVDLTGIPVQIDNLSDQYRNLLQVQTQIVNEYTLRLEFIKTDISKQIIYDNLLSDYILLSDYNANSVDTYRELKVSLVSIDAPENFKNRSQVFNIKFVDYKQNLLKRFY